MIEKGLFKRLENIENAQKGLINDINKPDSVRSKSSISSTFDSISSKSKDEDEQENEKTADELYQNSGIEGMKGLILPGEEIKNEKSQMYLENNLNKIKNNFPDIYNKYQNIFKYIANKEEDIINYEKLSSKVDNINLYKTLYNYINSLQKKLQ